MTVLPHPQIHQSIFTARLNLAPDHANNTSRPNTTREAKISESAVGGYQPLGTGISCVVTRYTGVYTRACTNTNHAAPQHCTNFFIFLALIVQGSDFFPLCRTYIPGVLQELKK